MRSIKQARLANLPRYTWRLLLLLSLANGFNFYTRHIVSVLAVVIKSEFNLTDFQVGALNSAFEFSYPLAAVLFALTADRWGKQRIIAVVVTLWSLATALTGVAGSYLALILARLGVGAGHGGYGPAALAKLSEEFPLRFRAQAVGIHTVGLIFGSAAGFALSGLIAQTLGWRVSFVIAGLPGLLVAWSIWRLKSPARPAKDVEMVPPSQPTSQLAANALRKIFSVPSLRVIYLSGILIYLATGGLIFWLPTHMQRYHGYSLASAAAVSGLLQVTVGFVGVLFGGWLGDQWTQRHPGGKLLTMGVGLVIGTPLGILGILSPSRGGFLIGSGLALFLYSFTVVCTGPQIHEVTPPKFAATSQAVFLFFTHYLGNLPAAPAIGWLSDLGFDVRTGMAVLASLGFLSGLLMLWGARFIVQDSRVTLEEDLIKSGKPNLIS